VWSPSRPGRFTPGERAPGTHWIGGWVGPRAGLDDAEIRKVLPLRGLKLRSLCRPARSQSLYPLRCLTGTNGKRNGFLSRLHPFFIRWSSCWALPVRPGPRTMRATIAHYWMMVKSAPQTVSCVITLLTVAVECSHIDLMTCVCQCCVHVRFSFSSRTPIPSVFL
jgi:hypothetical protein